ncbi:FG-GAP repeat protein [Streptomyces collinus]|uniref:FG-GAP repeat protein n=1 Tax=Streptomyces collinus TaxID=42684 RepID=UPI003644339D
MVTSAFPDAHRDGDGYAGAAVSALHESIGSAVRLADLDGDSHADLSVGACGENGGDGAVWSLRGSGSGVRTTGAPSFGPSAVGVSTSGFPQLGALMGQ